MTWPGRFRTAASVPQLLIAVLLVHLVPMRFWRGYLGTLSPQATRPAEPDMLREARRRASHIARAAGRMPFKVKCLPQAMALQWQLRRSGIPSRLVIAKLKSPGAHDVDPYHAWVELGETMVLGICERSDYAALMILRNEPT